MNLLIHFVPSLRITRDDTGERVAIDRLYPLPGEDGSFRVLRHNTGVRIRLLRAGAARMTVAVPLFSQVNGLTTDGRPIHGHYLVKLDATQPFAAGRLAEMIEELGVHSARVTPMSAPILQFLVPTERQPSMKTDGVLSTWNVAETAELAARTGFTVSNATWAVCHDNFGVNRVCIWPGAMLFWRNIRSSIMDARTEWSAHLLPPPFLQ